MNECEEQDLEEKRLQFLRWVETGVLTDAMRLLKADYCLDDTILPVKPGCKMAGRAFTVHISETTESGPAKAIRNFEVVDMCRPGDVFVIAPTDTGGRAPHSLMGENLVHAMINKGVVGVVVGGKSRDYETIAKMDIPVFTQGPTIKVPGPELQMNRVNTPLPCGGVVVQPGDYIVGDGDGVLAIPPADIDRLIYQAERIAVIEQVMEAALDAGIDLVDLVEISKLKKNLRK